MIKIIPQCYIYTSLVMGFILSSLDKKVKIKSICSILEFRGCGLPGLMYVLEKSDEQSFDLAAGSKCGLSNCNQRYV